MRTKTVLLSLSLLAGCASTPQSRIEKTPEAFGRLPPDQQALVRAGDVAIGFDEVAARLSLGEPDRIVEQETAQGKSLLWLFYQTEQGPMVGFCSGFHGGLHHRYPLLSSSTCYAPQTTQSERMRVVFREGHIAVIERSTSP